MKRLIYAILIYFCASSAFGAAVNREMNESKESFAMRFAPAKGQLAHPVIETKEWHFGSPAVIAFFVHPYPPPQEDQSKFGSIVTGYIFVPLANGKYEKVEIDSYEPEGRNAEIESVFFSRTGGTREKKMFVLASWHPNQADLYQTRIYDRPLSNSLPAKLSQDKELGLKIDGGCVYCRKGTATAIEIKQRLRGIYVSHL